MFIGLHVTFVRLPDIGHYRTFCEKGAHELKKKTCHSSIPYTEILH